MQKMIERRSAAGLSGSRLDESYQSYPLMYWPREERTWFRLQFKFGLALQHDLQCTISVANLSERGQISFLALALTVPLGQSAAVGQLELPRPPACPDTTRSNHVPRSVLILESAFVATSYFILV